MAENKPFVINDRRKFTAEGELRPDAPHEPTPERSAPQAEPERSSSGSETPVPGPVAVAKTPDETESADQAATASQPDGSALEEPMPPPPTAEETEQVQRAYDATVDRLDTAIRASNPGADRMPPMTFERMVQSLYMQSLLQLGGATEPGQPPRVDLIGARDTIDMLAVLAEKVKGNLSDGEEKLLQSALFELHMGFLEVTQALARQASARQPGAPGSKPGAGGSQPGAPAAGAGGPIIVR